MRIIIIVVALWCATFARAQCDGRWLPGFGSTELSFGKTETVVEWDPDGPGARPPVLVAGGYISSAGYRPIANLAAWNGMSWNRIGGEVERPVTELAVYRGELIAVGAFSGGSIWAWNGSKWREFGGGVRGSVSAMTVLDDRVYVAGGSLRMQGKPMSDVVAWDGNAWHDIGGTFENGGVNAFAIYNGELVAGGNFSRIDGEPIPAIARWDGSAWRGLGLGIVGTVHALHVFAGELIVGGGFHEVGGMLAPACARWDGASWRPLPADGFIEGFVSSMHEFQGGLVLCGQFACDGEWIGRLAAWNGKMLRLPPGGEGSGGELVVHGGRLIMTGPVEDEFGYTIDSLLAWDGAVFMPVGGRPDLPIAEFFEHNGQLFMGGYFREFGAGSARGVVSWDGTGPPRPVGAGISGGFEEYLVHVGCFAAYHGALIAAGHFANADGVEVNHIARWDGSAWRSLGGGVTTQGGGFASVGSLLVREEELIVSGEFTHAGGVPAMRLARWDGTTWHAFGGDPPRSVWKLIEFRGEIIASGHFVFPGGVHEGVARWDGAVWVRMEGAPFAQSVHDLVVYRDALFACGTNASYPHFSIITRWDGASWQSMGSGGDDVLQAMAVYNDELIVAGRFGTFNGFEADDVVRWDGTTWRALGMGTDEVVSALGAYRGEMMIGGGFHRAGDEASQFWARWSDSGAPWTARSPHAITVRASATATMEGAAAPGYDADASLVYRWLRNGIEVSDGPEGASAGGGVVSGASGPELAIVGAQRSDAGEYRLVASNACGSSESAPATLTVLCAADVNEDGAVDSSDLFAFLAAFLDGGSDFNADGASDSRDFFDFLVAFFGC